ncbi:hypothetical protein [Patulibacter defluvii]|uniref:hypothetical protein n=1 Tax=Patulibacter defluvii TaxID=3095358 RepID=UPI002A760DDE|nr:hypothetical protein [Patulibacter sp. DM4]
MALAALVVAVAAAWQPLRPLGAAAVAVLVGAVGHGLVGSITHGLPAPARAGLALGTALTAFGVAFQALADSGAFAPATVALVALVAIALVAGGARGAGRRIATGPLLLLALLGAGAASLPAYAFDLGGRDAGFYVMTSERLRHEGGLKLPLDPDVRDGLRRFGGGALGIDRQRPFPGLFVTRGGAIVPHGYHVTPATMAAGASATGGGGQWVVTLAGAILVLLAGAAAALLVRARDHAPAAGAAMALLATDAALIYFSRYPMTEVPSGAVLLTAAVAAALAIRDGGRRAALLAGFALGAAPLVRPDAWPLVAVAPVVAVLLARRGRDGALWLTVGLLPPLLYAAVRGLTLTRGYTDETVGHVLGSIDGSWLVAGIAAVVLAACALIAVVGRRGLPRALAAAEAGLLRALARIPARPLAALLVLAGIVLAVAPPSLGLRIFGTYATAPGIVLAAAGLALLVLGAGATAARERVAVLPLLLLGLIALALVARDPQVLVPDQYWTARRYLPLALPLAAALGGVAVALAWRHRDRAPAGRPLAALAVLLLLAAAAIGLRDARPAITTTEFDGVPAMLDRLDDQLGGGDPLVLVGPNQRAWATVAPSLAIRSGRAVTMLGNANLLRYRTRALLDDPRLTAWLERVAARRPVLLLTSGIGLASIQLDSRRFTAVLVGGSDFFVREIDHRVGGPPRTSDVQGDTINVWRLSPVAGGR